jgi:hypothetical protein
MELKFKANPKQKLALKYLFDEITESLGYGGGGGGGKSFLGVFWVWLMCQQFPGVRYFFGRNELKNLKRTTLVSYFEFLNKYSIPKSQHGYYNPQDSVIKFPNESEILLLDLKYKPSDPLSRDLGGLLLTGGLIDESYEVKFSVIDTLYSRIGRWKNKEYGIFPKILETFNPDKGHVYRRFFKPFTDGSLPEHMKFVRALVIDRLKHREYFKKNHLLHPEDENTEAGIYVKQLLKRDKITKERLLWGNFNYDDDPSCLFEFDVIADLFTNKAKNQEDKWLIGDVSRKGRDRMVIGYWEGLQLKNIWEIPFAIKSNTRLSAQWIIAKAEKYGVRRSHIILDEDGVGGGVVDNIPGCIGFVNGASAILTDKEKKKRDRGEFFNNYGNLKTQCYFKLASLAEAGEIGIDEPDESKYKEFISEELEQIKQKDIEKDGKIYIIGKEVIKEDLGRSPDFADMIMMRCFPEINKRPKPDII